MPVACVGEHPRVYSPIPEASPCVVDLYTPLESIENQPSDLEKGYNNEKPVCTVNSYTIIFETALVLTMACVVWAFSRSMALRERKQRADARRLAELEKLDSLTRNPNQRTVDLIGKDAYSRMTQRINTVLQMHKRHKSITLTLTCGPDSRSGAEELHSILPGEKVEVNMTTEAGVEWTDVYSRGVRIGRFGLLADGLLRQISSANAIKGAYVAEQNCYGIENSCQLSVIFFFEPHNDGERRAEPDKSVISPSLLPDAICEN